MTTEPLRLPTPAATLLERTHAILDAHVTPHTPGGEGWKLGGGTVLAAHWHHRTSFDLDLQIHPETERAHLEQKRNPELWRKMYAAGATRIEIEATPTIFFGNEGRIEFVEARPIPRHGHKTEQLPSGRAVVLAPSQILTGKLIHRALSAPVRDLYDLGVARTADPKATAIAVNTLTGRQVQAAAAHWKRHEVTYQKDARTELEGVAPEYTHIAENPALHARETLQKARYVAIHVEVGSSGIVVRLQNAELGQQLVYEDGEQARYGFEAAGVNAAIRAAGFNPGRIRNECNNALDAGRAKTILTAGEAPSGGSGNQGRNPDRNREGGPTR